MSAPKKPSEPVSEKELKRVERLLELEEQYQGLTLNQILAPLPGESDKQTASRLKELFELIPALAGLMLLKETRMSDSPPRKMGDPEPSEPESETPTRPPSPDQQDVFQSPEEEEEPLPPPPTR
jgi:hypothetical protein